MVITFSAILIGLLALVRPLQKNSFYILHAAIVILAAYYVETHYFRASAFGSKTMLLFLVFHAVLLLISSIKGLLSAMRGVFPKTRCICWNF